MYPAPDPSQIQPIAICRRAPVRPRPCAARSDRIRPIPGAACLPRRAPAPARPSTRAPPRVNGASATARCQSRPGRDSPSARHQHIWAQHANNLSTASAMPAYPARAISPLSRHAHSGDHKAVGTPRAGARRPPAGARSDADVKVDAPRRACARTACAQY
ncbi:hypothetical protein HYPSUDRAFT_200180 [Hypholoma sublateritium FD-334 SS-4]|uniref:Uncharacterized protein n=1 Tax=Hypholoma sublateritium (strain FD-334 SS-4) TaxID=945553 RepID=A0A0D2LCC8_HYPSF|nr:hypothetical protein HYPSUDRAFT_200180 [Hypholoma sublateritium FD-334 SS-4]